MLPQDVSRRIVAALPAEGPVIRVFKLDDCDWWAGASLRECIAAARFECGAGTYEGAEQHGREVTPEQMQRLRVHRDEDRRDEPITFAEHLAELTACKSQRFPTFFASTES